MFFFLYYLIFLMIRMTKTNNTIKKVEFYHKNKSFVFIKTTFGRFYNGTIISYTKEYIILSDRVLNEILIPIEEIEIIERHKEKQS
ncbi:MAG: hypothetical protein KatS3mg096_719 [Candidatus Parcubacteria bacterium]|nr:MAG: hypothetical protein KatS3mg096_691 [Candidatus Parcubacteria bacterium]GIW67851.1 MAG: hypothetical protein KatS3mg096_719 [Candidatus Parcubacteria bacterium]